MIRVNRTLHGRSVHRKRDVRGHNVILGYSRPGTGDGVDLFAPAGTPIVAMHAGKVTRVADRDGRLSCTYLVGKKGDLRVTSVYAHLHLKDYIVVGAEVHEGQVIGYIGRELNDPHLHLELWVNNVCLAAPTARQYARELNTIVG